MNMLKAIINLFRFDRTNWRAAFLCMFAALVFWFFNALNKNYSTNIRFPLRFDYNLEKFVPVETLPHRITLNVSGTGWELFREFMGFKQPELTISLERPTEVKKIAGVSLTPILQPQLNKLKINYIVTDTLLLQLDEVDSHRFKLFADLSRVSFQESFGRVSPVVILPDSVELTGPKAILHSLPDSLPINIEAGTLDQNFEEDIEVAVPSTFINRNPPQVNVMFEVGRMVELELYLKRALRKNQSTSFPDSVRCRFLLPEKREEDFHRHKNEMRLYWDGSLTRVINKPAFAELLETDSLAKMQPL